MESADLSTAASLAPRLEARPLLRAHAELCRALGHEYRLAILCALREGEMCVGELAEALDLPLHTVSQHLRVLREHKLVRSRKDGQMVYYVVNNMKFVDACVLMREGLLEVHQAEGESLLAAELLDASPRPPQTGRTA